MWWSTGEFLKEFILSVKEYAEIYMSSAVFEVVNTEWSRYQQLWNLKKNQDLTVVRMLLPVVVADIVKLYH